MAEGMTRDAAITAAKSMMGQDDPKESIILPAFELPLIRLVSAVHRQWRTEVIGLGQSYPVAFDLVAVDVAARWLGLKPDARLLSGLQILEREALKLKRSQR